MKYVTTVVCNYLVVHIAVVRDLVLPAVEISRAGRPSPRI